MSLSSSSHTNNEEDFLTEQDKQGHQSHQPKEEAPLPALSNNSFKQAQAQREQERNKLGEPSEESKEVLSDAEPDHGALLQLIGPAYARSAQFWKLLLFSSALQGAIMALIAVAFFLGYDELARLTWKTDEYNRALDYRSTSNSPASDLDLFRLGQGHWWYVGLLAGAGLAVGLIKVVWNEFVSFCWTRLGYSRENHGLALFPVNPPGLVEDLSELRAHVVWLPIPMMACSIVSIGAGASLGPEAALGAAGTSLGTIIGQRWRFGSWLQAKPISSEKNNEDENGGDQTAEQADEEQGSDQGEDHGRGGNEEESYSFLERLLPDFSQDSKACGLDGIVASFGALLPSQYLSPMLIFELGVNQFFGPGGLFVFTEAMAKAGMASSISYMVYTSIKDQTILEEMTIPVAAYQAIETIDTVYLVYAAILGVICGVVGGIGFILLGLGKKLGERVFERLQTLGEKWGFDKEKKALPFLLTPVIGGALIGLLTVASPLILSEGNLQLETVLLNAEELGAKTLICSMFLKLVAVGLSLGFGFIGGQIFPFLFTGACLGSAAHVLVPGLPLLVAYPACLVGVPCAFLPAIISFTTLAAMTLVLGGAGTSPIFVAAVCSYSTVCGLGLVQDLVELGTRKKKEQ